MPSIRTINGLVEASIRAHPDRPALGMAFALPLTYAALGESIRLLTAALLARGITKGERVAILAENSPSWGVVYLAVTRCGALAVPILPDFPEADVHHIFRESQVEFVFTSRRYLEKILEFTDQAMTGIFTLDDSDPEHRDTTETFSGLLHQGASLPLDAINVGDSLPISPNDIASITTKGIPSVREELTKISILFFALIFIIRITPLCSRRYPHPPARRAGPSAFPASGSSPRSRRPGSPRLQRPSPLLP